MKFNSIRVEKFINYVMESGKKDIARAVVYDALDLIKEKETVENPMEVLKQKVAQTKADLAKSKKKPD